MRNYGAFLRRSKRNTGKHHNSMARGMREIRRKMKAVKSTRQVTKAMELVAASKMRRAVQNAHALREYASAAWKILRRIADVHPDLHPFLQEKPAKNVLAVVM